MAAHLPVVLYVEDDESDRFFMERAFAAAGLSSALRIVNDGQTAINYLSGLDRFGNRSQYPLPDFVLLDLNLPQISGFQVLQWIRKHPSYATLPVIIFSASAHDEDRARAKTLGAQDYLQKPSSGLQYPNVVANLRDKWLSPTPASPSHQPRATR